MFTEDIRVGEDYHRLKRCVCISILDFNLTEDEDYNKVYRLQDQKGRLFSDMLEVRVIELHKKLKENEKLNDWIRLLNAKTEEDLDMIETKNPGVLEAIKEIREMGLSKRMRVLHEARLKERRDKWAREQYVLNEGREKGRAEERINTELERRRADAAEGRAKAAEGRADAAEEEVLRLKEEVRRLKEKR